VSGGGGPVIPNFGGASKCITNNDLFCADWVRDNWRGTLEPALIEHIKLTAIAVSIGFVIALAGAIVARRFRVVEHPFSLFSALLYTVPSIALFQLLVPITGLTETTVEVALVGYTLLILFRNDLAGFRAVPDDVIEAARGMGLRGHQILWRVELPLAMPAIIAGLRIAVVTIVSLATLAAFVIPEGLGHPIFIALRDYFKTEIIAAGALAVLLALALDGGLVLVQRFLTPWTRARAA
jgi:osmoprotectant transport system permease protein